MEKKFVIKLIENCFSQYEYEKEDVDLNEMYQKVIKEKEDNPTESLYDIINDMVYEYLTQN